MKGVNWAEFEREAAGLGSDVRRLIERFGFALVGTVRRDGTPRISPVETHLVGDELTLVMLPRTRKAADLRRDDRIVLQSPITNAGDPGAEFKLRGRVVVIEDRGQREATATAVQSDSGWRPHHSWLFLAVMIEDVTQTVWRTDGSATMTRWSVAENGTRTVQLRLDEVMGGYRFE